MIVIPMVGASSRFINNGYKLPKYMLPFAGETLLYFAVKSFWRYFNDEIFVISYREDRMDEYYIKEVVKKLGIKNVIYKPFRQATRGQAETVYKSLDFKQSGELIIFNIDTIHLNFEKFKYSSECSGYLEVFAADGDRWSFVKLSEQGNVILTTEKNRVSDLCSNGLYGFSTQEHFKWSYEQSIKNFDYENSEHYIAPLYNQLIKEGHLIKVKEITSTEMIQSGIPSEYEIAKDTEIIFSHNCSTS